MPINKELKTNETNPNLFIWKTSNKETKKETEFIIPDDVNAREDM